MVHLSVPYVFLWNFFPTTVMRYPRTLIKKKINTPY